MHPVDSAWTWSRPGLPLCSGHPYRSSHLTDRTAPDFTGLVTPGLLRLCTQDSWDHTRGPHFSYSAGTCELWIPQNIRNSWLQGWDAHWINWTCDPDGLRLDDMWARVSQTGRLVSPGASEYTELVTVSLGCPRLYRTRSSYLIIRDSQKTSNSKVNIFFQIMRACVIELCLRIPKKCPLFWSVIIKSAKNSASKKWHNQICLFFRPTHPRKISYCF